MRFCVHVEHSADSVDMCGCVTVHIAWPLCVFHELCWLNSTGCNTLRCQGQPCVVVWWGDWQREWNVSCCKLSHLVPFPCLLAHQKGSVVLPYVLRITIILSTSRLHDLIKMVHLVILSNLPHLCPVTRGGRWHFSSSSICLVLWVTTVPHECPLHSVTHDWGPLGLPQGMLITLPRLTVS